VSAINDVFGDPCAGIGKAFSGQVLCGCKYNIFHSTILSILTIN
jgi:hypothetical protein